MLIGPFDGRAVRTGAASALQELDLDEVARIDPDDVRYAWFEHALNGAERPALLRAAVNYQVAGSNEWRHAESLEALENEPVRLYLAALPGGGPHALVRRQPAVRR